MRSFSVTSKSCISTKGTLVARIPRPLQSSFQRDVSPSPSRKTNPSRRLSRALSKPFHTGESFGLALTCKIEEFERYLLVKTCTHNLLGSWIMFHTAFPNKAVLASSISLNPKPPYSFGKVILFQLTKCHPFA